MSAVPADLIARASALGAGLSTASDPGSAGALARQALDLASAVVPGEATDDVWFVSRADGRVSIVGPDVMVFAAIDGLQPSSVRVMSGTRILHVGTGDPTDDTGGLMGMLGAAGIDVGGLLGDTLSGSGLGRLLGGGGGAGGGAVPAGADDEYRQRSIGSMRVSVVDGDRVIVNAVYDAVGIGRPATEIAMEEASERFGTALDGFEQYAEDPGETDNSTVSAPSSGGVPGSSGAGTQGLGSATGSGGSRDLTAAAGSVAAVAAAAALRRLLRSASQRQAEPEPEPEQPTEPSPPAAAPPPGEAPAEAPAPAAATEPAAAAPHSSTEQSAPFEPEAQAPTAPTAAPHEAGPSAAAAAPSAAAAGDDRAGGSDLHCGFCGRAIDLDDRFCRGCGRPGPEARGEVWVATHTTPAGGLYAFERADPSLAPSATLAAGLPLQVRQSIGVWSEVVASNGWSGWVDGRYLDPL